MKYLYFADGKFKQAGTPTKTDMQRALRGALHIFRYDNNGIAQQTGTFQELGKDGRWHDVQAAGILAHDGEYWHG